MTVTQEFKTVDECTSPHLVDVFMSYWEGEGESQWQFLMLDVVFVQKV